MVQTRHGQPWRNLIIQMIAGQLKRIIGVLVRDQQHLGFPFIPRLMRDDPIDHRRQGGRGLRRQPSDGHIRHPVIIRVCQRIVHPDRHG